MGQCARLQDHHHPKQRGGQTTHPGIEATDQEAHPCSPGTAHQRTEPGDSWMDELLSEYGRQRNLPSLPIPSVSTASTMGEAATSSQRRELDCKHILACG